MNELAAYTPSFFWLLRDFYLDLSGGSPPLIALSSAENEPAAELDYPPLTSSVPTIGFVYESLRGEKALCVQGNICLFCFFGRYL